MTDNDSSMWVLAIQVGEQDQPMLLWAFGE